MSIDFRDRVLHMTAKISRRAVDVLHDSFDVYGVKQFLWRNRVKNLATIRYCTKMQAVSQCKWLRIATFGAYICEVRNNGERLRRFACLLRLWIDFIYVACCSFYFSWLISSQLGRRPCVNSDFIAYLKSELVTQFVCFKADDVM